MKCKHCGSEQIDPPPINSDAYRCRKCGEYTSLLELVAQRRTEQKSLRQSGEPK